MKLTTYCGLLAIAVVLLLPALTGTADEKSGKSISGVPASSRIAIPEKSVVAKAATRVFRGTIDDADIKLEDGSFAESWIWTGTKGDSLALRMESSAFDPYLILLRKVGESVEAIAEDDNGGGGTTAKLEVILPETGTYYVIANTAGPGQGGAYVLQVAGSPGGATEAPEVVVEGGGVIELATVVTAKITSADPKLSDGSHIDVWSFTGKKSQVVTLQMASDDIRPWVGFAAVKNGRVGKFLVQNMAGESGKYVELTFEFPGAGQYAVCTGAAVPGATGKYSVLLTEDRPRATPIADLKRQYPGGGNPDDTYALLVGIDDYPGTANDLNSCVADVALWRNLLVNQYGVDPDNIVAITDSAATADHLYAAFQRHLAQAGPKGAAIFVYSGHGAQLESNLDPQDDEPDGRDEAIAVWAAPPRGYLITDDMLGRLISGLRTDRVVVVMDSCNSGTGTRGEKDRAKEMKYKDIKDLYDVYEGPQAKGGAGRPAAGTGSGREPTGHILLAACKPNETALPWPGTAWSEDLGVASVFTYFLITELRKAGDGITFLEAMQKVKLKVVNFSQKQRGSPQTPQVEGTGAGQPAAGFLSGR